MFKLGIRLDRADSREKQPCALLVTRVREESVWQARWGQDSSLNRMEPPCEEGRDLEGRKEPGSGVWGISSLGTSACSTPIGKDLSLGCSESPSAGPVMINTSFLFCSRTVYYMSYRQVYATEARTVFRCCPGWSQKPGQEGCLSGECPSLSAGTGQTEQRHV